MYFWVDYSAYIKELQASVGRPETDRQTDKKQNLKS
jgi:hypothetical protein